MEISILRLFHRVERDKRVTTHLALVGRAFCASRMFYTGDRDKRLEEKIREVNDKFGGNFEVIYIDNPIQLINRWKEGGGIVVHLTMYGIPLPDVIDELRSFNKILLIVGSEKVPRIYYEISDYNVSITSQPHSEIAAAAVFLDRLLEGKEFYMDFNNARYKVVPSPKGKKLIRLG